MGAQDQSRTSYEGSLQAEFCAFLNSDRSEAGLTPEQAVEQRARRYLEIQSKLERLFAWRGCFDAEELARATLDRAEQKWAEKRFEDPTGEAIRNPVAYVCGFARFVFLEWLRRPPLPAPPPAPQTTREDAIRLECLDDCMERLLEARERKLILSYYEGEKGDRIRSRRRIAGSFDTSPNALRIECYRIRRRLAGCVRQCVEQRGNESAIALT